jgi:hypothetical protein
VLLQIHPAGAAERASRTTTLPVPMYENNEVGSSRPLCAMGKNLTRLVAGSPSWTATQDFSNQLYPTDGLETTSQGQPLTLQVGVGGCGGGGRRPPRITRSGHSTATAVPRARVVSRARTRLHPRVPPCRWTPPAPTAAQ